LARATPALVDFRLYLISDRRSIAPRDLAQVCDEVLAALARDPAAAGVALQRREKDPGGRELYRLAVALRAKCTRHGARLIVNDRLDVALAAEADGVIAATPDIGWTRNYLGITYQSAPEVTAAMTAAADGGAQLLLHLRAYPAGGTVLRRQRPFLLSGP
jgi:hypothetical protein